MIPNPDNRSFCVVRSADKISFLDGIKEGFTPSLPPEQLAVSQLAEVLSRGTTVPSCFMAAHTAQRDFRDCVKDAYLQQVQSLPVAVVLASGPKKSPPASPLPKEPAVLTFNDLPLLLNSTVYQVTTSTLLSFRMTTSDFRAAFPELGLISAPVVAQLAFLTHHEVRVAISAALSTIKIPRYPFPFEEAYCALAGVYATFIFRAASFVSGLSLLTHAPALLLDNHRKFHFDVLLLPLTLKEILSRDIEALASGYEFSYSYAFLGGAALPVSAYRVLALSFIRPRLPNQAALQEAEAFRALSAPSSDFRLAANVEDRVSFCAFLHEAQKVLARAPTKGPPVAAVVSPDAAAGPTADDPIPRKRQAAKKSNPVAAVAPHPPQSLSPSDGSPVNSPVNSPRSVVAPRNPNGLTGPVHPHKVLSKPHDAHGYTAPPDCRRAPAIAKREMRGGFLRDTDLCAQCGTAGHARANCHTYFCRGCGERAPGHTWFICPVYDFYCPLPSYRKSN